MDRREQFLKDIIFAICKVGLYTVALIQVYEKWKAEFYVKRDNIYYNKDLTESYTN